MNPKLLTRAHLRGQQPSRPVFSVGDKTADPSLKTSVRDQAALLLSIADIAKLEIGSIGFSALWEEDEDLPKFPSLSAPSSVVGTGLTPRRESLLPAWVEDTPKETSSFSRIRSVSIDSPKSYNKLLPMTRKRVTSPLLLGPAKHVTPNHSPISNRRLPLRKQSLRLSSKARHEDIHGNSSSEETEHQSIDAAPMEICSSNKSSSEHPKNKPLQGPCPKGLALKKIQRRKFSWKNYPELEQFLIANREEYLRHSALNYTVQQKQYNNRLTEELLDLATEHGYFFDEKEFSFVTVRDRIRCYYKSFVQSAKKRGILMGYAARKAGLLTEEELQKSAEQESMIVNP